MEKKRIAEPRKKKKKRGKGKKRKKKKKKKKLGETPSEGGHGGKS